MTALQWHSYESLPAPGAVALARSPACLQAFRIGDHAWGVQFHPEAVREDVEAWILDHGQSDAGFDARAALEQMGRHIDRWNETGRSIAHRFIDHVEAVKMSAAPRSLTAT